MTDPRGRLPMLATMANSARRGIIPIRYAARLLATILNERFGNDHAWGKLEELRELSKSAHGPGLTDAFCLEVCDAAVGLLKETRTRENPLRWEPFYKSEPHNFG